MSIGNRTVTPGYLLWCVLLVLLVSGRGLAQTETSTRKTDLENVLDERTPKTVVQPQGIALESTVDPSAYYVGPSDMIAVNIWMSPPVNLSLTVTPEGTLIIPTVGEVRVSDLTLKEAKLRILEQVRRKYLTAEVTSTLIRPRPIIVTVTGNVLNEGLYTLSAIDRANKAIDEANKPTRLQRADELTAVLAEMSTRNIIVSHHDGNHDHADIPKFLATKEDRWNPYLREGDVIVVPRKNPYKNIIGVYGEVNSPGRYEFVEGDSLSDALRIAQGFTRLALIDSMIFSRLSMDGTSLTTRVIDGSRILTNHVPNFPLEPGDRIVVKSRTELREDYRVTVDGEVLYPGVYPITKNRTHLSDVIRQAGGFTEFASLKSSELNRRSVQPGELETERLLSLRGGVSAEDSAYYYRETDLRLRKEIVNVNFERLFGAGDSTQDVILQGEDYITVPSVKKTIYVFGQIVSSGHIPFVAGQNLDYYVRQAGGFTDRARRGDARIIKGKTKQWLAPGDTAIEEGDYIWVPKEPDHSFSYYMTVASQAASVLSVIIGIGVVIIQLAK